jgi:diguanylate cyclase (GGDEF)-like protein
MHRNVFRPARKNLALLNRAGTAGRERAAGSKSRHGVLAIDGVTEGHDRPMSSVPGLEKTLASALLAQDKGLEQILREVDSLAKTFQKSDSRDAHALSGALRRTVLCAVKQSLLDRELRSLALTDDLTSLYNRRAFFALATQQLKVMRRRGRGLLLFFADVDHLKDINDTFGHREGDLALVRTANALEQTFRDSDIVARLSGDEFAVLALEASSGDQDAILHRLQDKLAEVSAEEDRYKLSVSVGMVRFDPKHDLMLGELLSKADRAMYAEKKNHPKSWTTRTRAH